LITRRDGRSMLFPYTTLFRSPPAQVVVEPQLAALVAGGLHRLVPPLQQPLGVGEAARLLGVGGGGQEEHLGGDLFRPQLTGLDRSEEHTSELQSRENLVCRLL